MKNVNKNCKQMEFGFIYKNNKLKITLLQNNLKFFWSLAFFCMTNNFDDIII